MPRYIDVDDFIEQKRKWYCENCDRRKGIKKGKEVFCYEIGDAPCRACDVDDMLNDVDNFPTADVAPVKHGKWILDREEHSMCEDEYICSKCKVSVCSEGWCDEKFLEMNKYCPSCGAKMDLE